MLTEHPIFNPPKNINQKIWRYLDFTKFVDLLNTSSLFFSRPDLFEDIFEGSLPKATVDVRNSYFNDLIEKGQIDPSINPKFWHDYKQEARKEYAINCWHINDFESAAMWKLYVKSNEGIAIQSTYKRLIDSFDKTNVAIQVGEVKYIDYERDTIDNENGFSAYIHKRKSFEHEKELRCIIWQCGYGNEKLIDLKDGGTKIKIDLNELIESIYVSPYCQSWFTELVEAISRKFGITIPPTNSRLKDLPIF